MAPVRKNLIDPLVCLEPGACRRMMRLIGYDFVDPGNFIQASHDRHHACDRDLSGKVAGSRIDSGQVYSRPNKVELFYRLTQQLIPVNKHKSLVITSTQA